METRAPYVLIGAMVVAAIVAVFGFVYWFHNTGGLTERGIYRVQFEQPISGLLRGATVLFNGIRVGEVVDLGLDPSHPRRVIATVAVDRGTPINGDTQVDVDFQGLTGVPAIAMKGGDPASPLIPPSRENPPVLTALPEAGQSLTQSARETLRKIDGILVDNRENLKQTVANLSNFTGMLSRNSDRLDGIIGGLERLTGGGTQKTTASVYDLVAPTSFPGLNKTLQTKLAVAEPTAVLMFDTQKVLARDASGANTPLENVQWSDNIPKLLLAKVIQSFENAKMVQSVTRGNEDMDAEFKLAMDIRGFHIALAPEPTAIVELTVRLLGKDGQVVQSRMIKSAIKTDNADPAAAVAALNLAFGKAAQELVTWTVQSI